MHQALSPELSHLHVVHPDRSGEPLSPLAPICPSLAEKFPLQEGWKLALRSMDVRDSFPSRAYYGTEWDTRDIRVRRTYTPSETLFLNILTWPSDQFVMPCQGKIISEFGPRSGRMHSGIDIKQNLNDTIVTVFDGIVRMARTYSGYGKVVVIRHYNGLETVYSHLNHIKVQVRDYVRVGDLIGLAGRTGQATTVHLHFEVRFRGEVLNPRLLVDFEEGVLRTEQLVLSPAIFRMYGKNISSPDSVQEISTPKEHVVRQGDTLFRISRKYGTTISRLCALNGISQEKVLRIGEIIKLP